MTSKTIFLLGEPFRGESGWKIRSIFAGSFPKRFFGSVIAPAVRRSYASPTGRMAGNSGGRQIGRPGRRKTRSSLGGGRAAGNGVPLYGHRRSPKRGAVFWRLARWRGRDRRYARGSVLGSRGIFCGSGGSRAAWLLVLWGIASSSSGTKRRANAPLSLDRGGYSIWLAGGLEAGVRSASRNLSGDMSARSRERLSPSASCGKRNSCSLVTTRFPRRELIHENGSLP